MKEEVKEATVKVFQEFVKQEQGNRITQFNIGGLVNALIMEIDKLYEPKPIKPSDLPLETTECF